MTFSHPSAEPVSTSPGRPSPQASPQARPFLELISDAYHSEGLQVPARVLRRPQDERTQPSWAPPSHADDDEGEITTEDRPRGRKEVVPLRGFVADPMTSVEPAGVHRQRRAVLSADELRGLPVVVGQPVPGDPSSDASDPNPAPRPTQRGQRRRARVRILPPVDAPQTSPSRATPPPVPEHTEVRRVVPPPLPALAIPPRPVAAVSAEGAPTDPHGRVYTADAFVLDESDANWLLQDETSADGIDLRGPFDDTDPYAKTIELDFSEVSQGEHTIELSTSILEELLLMERTDSPRAGAETLTTLNVDTLAELAERHGFGVIGTFDDEHSLTVPMLNARAYEADWDFTSESRTHPGPPLTPSVEINSPSAAQQLPMIVRRRPVEGDEVELKALVDVPDSPLLDVKQTAAFTLTGLMLTRPKEDGEAGAQRRKAHNIFSEAVKDYAAGRTKAAHTNAKLALAYDPSSRIYRAAVDRWGREAKTLGRTSPR